MRRSFGVSSRTYVEWRVDNGDFVGPVFFPGAFELFIEKGEGTIAFGTTESRESFGLFGQLVIDTSLEKIHGVVVVGVGGEIKVGSCRGEGGPGISDGLDTIGVGGINVDVLFDGDLQVGNGSASSYGEHSQYIFILKH